MYLLCLDVILELFQQAYFYCKYEINRRGQSQENYSQVKNVAE
jgi:hypothetical protein